MRIKKQENLISCCFINLILFITNIYYKHHIPLPGLVIAEYTNNTLAEVSQGTLGYCWKSPCCSGKAEHRLKRDKCSLYEFRENIYKNKLQDIINNSEFNIVIKNIVLGISNYLQRSYSQSKYDNKYRALILSKYKEVGAILIIAKIKTERAIDTWSYFDIGRILESEGAI